jgi:translocation and assembly module TamB
VLVVILALAAVVRLGPQSDFGRRYIESRLNGLDLGDFGRLGVAGLSGDPWGDFRAARVTLTDRRGVWLVARDVALNWRPGDLLARRVHIGTARIASLTLLHRPSIAAHAPSGGKAPFSVQIDGVRARIEMTPEFALRRGVYDLSGALDLERAGRVHVTGRATSVLHAGDFVVATVDLGDAHHFQVVADAREAQGGALAGSLGLAPDQPFFMAVRARGSLREGQAFVDTHIGRAQPVEVRAAWNPAGGEAHGLVDLTASSLLAHYRDMAGPLARIDIRGRQAADGFYAFDALAQAQNARLALAGEGNAGTMTVGPKGLALDVQVGETNRLVSFPKMGATRLAGILSGDRKHWRFVGTAAVQRVSDGPYSLASVSGPVRLENHGGDLVIDAQPSGGGGAGQGLLAALLGARPRASAQVTRLADGRFLMRQMTLEAVGLKASGAGARGLFGDLKFSGQARFSNLAMAHAGASGLVAMGWTASQAGRAPWAFTLDARGQNFGSGLAEADRLLGRTPHLVAKATYGGGAVAIASSTLSGSAAEAGASGTLGDDGAIALKLSWRARGPFEIGPMELAGQASGSGDLAGTLAAPRADLTAALGSIDVPGLTLHNGRLNLTFQGGAAGTDGKFALVGSSDYGPAAASSGFRFAGDGLDFTGLALKGAGVTASGALSLRKGEPSSADLTVAVGPGAVLSQGHADGRLRIVGGQGETRADVSLEAGEAVLRASGLQVKSLSFTAAGPLARLPYKIAANGPSAGGPWRLKGGGEWARQAADHVATFSGAGRLQKADFHTLSPAEVRLGNQGVAIRAAIAAGGGRADLDFANLAGSANVKATLADIDLSLLNEDYVGKISGQLALSGRGEHLSGGLDARLSGAGGRDLRGAPPVNGEVTAKLTGGAMNVDFHLGNSQGLKAVGDVVLPMQASAAPFRVAADYHRPLSGRLAVDGEFKPLWDLAVARGGADSLSGQVSVHMTLGGTLSDPRAVGQVSLDGGRFEDEDTGLRLDNVVLRANLADNAVDVTRFGAVDAAKGQISGSGRASLQRDGVSSFRADLNNFRIIDTDLARATASGQMTVGRAANGKVKLTGALTIDRAQISPNPPVASGVTPMEVVEIHRRDQFDDQPAQGAARVVPREAPVGLDVAIRAPGGVFVKGRGLNIELALDAHVGGDMVDPILTGTARVVRGDYDFAGQRFQLDERSVVRLGSTPETIRLELLATREDPSLTAMIRIGGVAAKPTITLSSNPSLPQDEILSRVLFGASASQLSGLEAAQLASAVAGLSGGGGFDLIGGLRSLAHLDRLAIADSAVTGPTIHGGKYISDRVYLELMGGGRQGEAAQLEWRVRKHVSLVGKLGSLGDSQLAIRWRKSY